MTTYFAQPYNLDAHGFFFEDLADYETKAEACRDVFGQPVEEFELQFIDGETADAELFRACGIDQSNLADWFDDVECLDEAEKAALFYLCEDLGYGLSDALAKIEAVCLSAQSLKDAAIELFDDCYAHELPDHLRHYIDYDAFARDCEVGGDLAEFAFGGQTYTCTNASTV